MQLYKTTGENAIFSCRFLLFLYNSEAFCKNAATISGKASRTGDTLAGRSCDGEGSVTLATESDTCIGGSVLDEYRSLNSSCESGEVVDVLRVHMRRVTEAVLCLNCKVDSLVNILNCLPVQEMQERPVQSLGQEDPLEKEMTTLSSILTWKIP